MDDVFEDVESAQEFSDADDDLCGEDAAALSDDEIARVLGLMGDENAVPRPAHVGSTEADDKRTEEPSHEKQAEMSDFDRFLADFTRLQAASRPMAPTKDVDTSVKPPPVGSQAPAAPSSRSAHGRESHPTKHVNITEGITVATAFEALLEAEAEAAIPRSVPTLKWGVFTPDKMPPRREFESLRAARSPTKATPPKKLKVVVPSVAFLRTKNARLPRTSEQINKELTFRPTINSAYYRRRGMARLRGRSKTRFTTRMQQDISEREERQKRREAEKRRQEEYNVRRLRQRRRSLVTKGSQAILERNGLWEEPLEDRLERLIKHSSRRFKSAKAPSNVAMSRKREKSREKEMAKARACETLYRRGLDKLKRERRDSVSMPLQSPQLRSRRRSDYIVRERLERDVRMICSQETDPYPHPDLPPSVSFVEFSCVLLYFGFVPAPNTPWEGDAQVSLLWHAWVTYSDGEGETRRVRMDVLKDILESIIVKDHKSSRAVCLQSGHGSKARLLEIFRLNYIGRKRPRGVSGAPQNGSKNNSTNRHSRPSAAITYTIHGKAIAPAQTPCDLLAVRHSITQQRVEAMRREKEQQELAECTFKPRISSTAVKDSQGSYRFREADDVSVSTEPEAFDRLYNDAFVRQNNSMAQHFRARQEEEEKCRKEMRVSPTYVNGLTVEERLERLHDSLSNNALPSHFHEKITEMRRAYAAKLEDAREKANRLEPAHTFPRSRDGHTIVIPFKFATQQRRNEKQRKGMPARSQVRSVSGVSRTTSAILREMRLHYEPSPDNFFTGDDEASESDAADLCIDVHVSPFETYQLCLNRGDDVHKAIKVFAETYNLDANQQEQLLRHAEAKLEELFDL